MKLKKLFAGIVAVAMMATMAAPVFATEPSVTPSTTTASTTLKNDLGDGLELNKNYNVVKGTSPEETFTFEMTYESSKYRAQGVAEPSIGTKTYTAHFDAKTVGDYDQGFTIPKTDLGIDGIGEYTYKIVEKAGNSASVKYDDSVLYMIVAVTHQVDNDKNITSDELVYTVTLRRGDATTGTKVAPADAFTNTYANDGEKDTVWNLSLTKTVQGDFADINRYYKFTITLNPETGKTYHGAIIEATGTSTDNVAVGTVVAIDSTAPITVYLKRNETFTLNNIPDGVTYTITEDKTDLEGYTVTGEVKEEKTVDGANVSETVNNKHDGTPDTGVILDNAPYIALMAIVVAGAAVMVIKKRRYNED